MPLPRMTTRRWMVATAAVASILGCSLRYLRCKSVASRYAQAAHRCEKRVESLGIYGSELGYLPEPERREFREKAASLARYRSLADQAEQAAIRPWLPVPPDPPPPE